MIRPYTRAQYASLQRLAALPGEVHVWPTHGAGSFCSAPPGADRTSTIAREPATNPLLQATDENVFVAQLLGSLGSYPPYFHRLGEVNRVGPPLLEVDARLAPLSVDEVRIGWPTARFSSPPACSPKPLDWQ